jgi:hypothetical protein
LYLAQRLRDLVLTIILQFDERCLRFVDDLLGARYLRGNLASPTLDVGRLTLKVHKAGTPLKTLLDQHGDGRRFVADDADAP